MSGKGSKRRPLKTTKAQFDRNWAAIYGPEYAEVEQAQIDELIAQSFRDGLSEEEIDLILDDRFGTSLEEQRG